MRKSIFTEFICLCAVVFVSAIVCIGAILLILSGEYYKSDRFKLLEMKFGFVLDAVASSEKEEGGIDAAKLKKAFEPLSEIIGADITLTDSDGVALVCSEASPCSHTDKKIGTEAMSRITEDGLYEQGSLDGYYSGDSFILAKKISLNGNNYCLLERLQENRLPQYMLKLTAALVVSSAVILTVAFAVVYTSAKCLLSPIKDMTLAAKRFGEGNFSEKLRVTDENELGYLANSLNEMASSLEQIEETRKTFISNVSHELKTPMTTIGGFIDGILDGTIPQEQHRHYLKIVSAEVSRLSRLVRSMLNISKYEAGELKMVSEDFDILPLIVRTLSNFEKRIEEKNIEVQINGTDGCRVNADQDLTGQVIYNLIDNAVKFVNKGGYIRFDFKEEENDMRSVSIRNSGDGLSKKEISKVFDRFYKTDESRGIDPGGVGLGLSIVSSVIKLQGGTIQVSSEPKLYTEFTFSLKKALNDRR